MAAPLGIVLTCIDDVCEVAWCGGAVGVARRHSPVAVCVAAVVCGVGRGVVCCGMFLDRHGIAVTAVLVRNDTVCVKMHVRSRRGRRGVGVGSVLCRRSPFSLSPCVEGRGGLAWCYCVAVLLL